MTDRGHYREREHGERHVALPAVPGAGLVVIKAELVLRGLEAVLEYATGGNRLNDLAEAVT